MSSANRRNRLGTALIVLAIALFVVPALFPIQPVLMHDTQPGTFDSQDQLEAEGIEIVNYENLSERGQEVYVQALEEGGQYSVPQGDGASDFEYLDDGERSQLRQENPDRRPGLIAIERPNDTDLPPANEPFSPEEVRGELEEGDRERQQQAQRYDLMEVSVEQPPLNAPSQLLRLAAILLALISLGIGGYLRSSQ